MEAVDPRINQFLTYLEESWFVMSWIDVLDIGFIGATLSLFLVWIKRRAFVSLVLVVIPLIFVYLAATTLKMYLTTTLFKFGFLVLAIGIVVAFQEDFRRGIEGLSSWRLQGVRSERSPIHIADVLVDALGMFSLEKVGALIILRGRQPLKPYIRAGIPVDAVLSLPLLQSIFDPHSAGHDGAITLVGGKIGHMGVHLPLSRRSKATGRLGTRHAAALGLVEVSDALVLVVSEETGAISVAQNGAMTKLDSAGAAKDVVVKFLRAAAAPRVTRVFHVPWFRLSGSLALAFVLWLAFVRPTDLVQRTVEIPILYRNLSSNWEADPPKPSRVRVTLLGPEGPVVNLDDRNLSASLDMAKVKEGRQRILVPDKGLTLPSRVRVKQISPHEVTVHAFPVEELELPVKVNWKGRRPSSLRYTVVPEKVVVRMPRSKKQPSLVITEPLSSGAKGTVELPLSVPGALAVTPSTVQVRIRREKN